MVDRVAPNKGKFKDLGEQIVRWVEGVDPLPAMDADGSVTDLQKFKDDMRDMVDLPDSVTAVKFIVPKINADNETFTYYIRLPLWELVQESRDKMQAADALVAEDETVDEETYVLPAFYKKFVNTDADNREYEDTLYRRIADYTFAHCK